MTGSLPAIRFALATCAGHVLRLLRARGGNTALLFSLALLPVAILIGGSVDYARTQGNQGQVQAALDAAVLAGAKEMQAAATYGRISAETNNYFREIAKLNKVVAECEAVTTDIDRKTYKLAASVSCATPTAMSSIIGLDKMTVHANGNDSLWRRENRRGHDLRCVRVNEQPEPYP